ncbi:MAG: sigma-70 family RNA polymerase sigma factor [Gemmataceae bacterium]
MRTPLVRMAGRLAPGQSDGELLGRFVRDRDEAAFAALVHRHGPTVLGVCRRVLRNPADADDAFQAVFLVLVNRADALADRPALGGWLYEVAVRVARKGRTSLARLRKREHQAARAEAVSDPPPADPPAWLDRELAALPDRLREPVVRCLVQDRPRAEVAAELGIPEGTLASRLDAARKRLADRLARHRVPLALTGLLVPVPASLSAATLVRATDESGAAIHQLANEVTRAMLPHTRWATVAAAGVLAVVGGLVLAGSGPSPTARQNPPTAAKEPKPAEPAWMTAFERVYRLADGQYVKRVAPPYIPERVLFAFHEEGRVAPAVRRWVPKQAAEFDKYYTLFIEQTGGRLQSERVISSAYLKDRPEEQQGDNLLPVTDVIGLVTGLGSPEFVIDPKSQGDPLFAERNKTVHGDFVTRTDAPLDKLVPQIEAILRDECKLDIRLTLREEEQSVFVVGGTFKPNPPAWRPRGELDIYATEDGLDKEYDFPHFEKRRRSPKLGIVQVLHYTGTPVEMVRLVGHRLGARMVWDAPRPTGTRISWHVHTISNPTSPEEAAADRDPDKVLKVVAEQTGLTFTKEMRKVTVLVASTPEKK